MPSISGFMGHGMAPERAARSDSVYSNVGPLCETEMLPYPQCLAAVIRAAEEEGRRRRSTSANLTQDWQSGCVVLESLRTSSFFKRCLSSFPSVRRALTLQKHYGIPSSAEET